MKQISYEDLRERLEEIESLIEAMLGGEADSVISASGVFLLRLHAADAALKSTLQALEEAVRTRDMEYHRLATAVDFVAESVIITDAQGVIVYANPAFEQTTGYSVEEALGATPRILKSGSHEEAFYRDLWTTISSGEVWRGKLINRSKSGMRLEALSTISPILSDGGRITGYVAVQHDVTRESKLEESLARAQKLEAMGRLAGGVAHDFNNLLTVIVGYGDLISADLSHTQILGMVQQIREASNKAANLTRRLLTFSRRQISPAAPAKLNDALRENETMLRRLIGEDIDLAFHLDAAVDSLYVSASASEIDQVLLNLCINSRDAMPGGGTLRVSTEPRELLEGKENSNPETIPGPYVLLKVRDSGCGMDERTLKRIFEPFFTTKEEGRGTGLGLATVYGIVVQNKGWIEVDSAVGHGATFRVFLPVVPAPSPDCARTGRTHAGRDAVVLLVEDERAVREFTALALRGEGFTVVEAASAANAVAIVESGRLKVDLLLTDVVMPSGDGPGLASKVAELSPGTRVLFVSGYPSDVLTGHGLSELNAGFLPKPYAAAALVGKVLEVLGKAGPAS